MHIIIYDFGTSSVKTCLFDIDSEVRLAAGATAGYSLTISPDGISYIRTGKNPQRCNFF